MDDGPTCLRAALCAVRDPSGGRPRVHTVIQSACRCLGTMDEKNGLAVQGWGDAPARPAWAGLLLEQALRPFRERPIAGETHASPTALLPAASPAADSAGLQRSSRRTCRLKKASKAGCGYSSSTTTSRLPPAWANW